MVRVLCSVSWRVHSWSDTIAFHGSSTICSPSSMALARTTSSSAVSSATLPISLRYIRTGSSMPIMSAERASSSSAVGSSTSFGSSLVGPSAGSREPGSATAPSPTTTSTVSSSASSSGATGISIVVVVRVVFVGHGRRAARGAQAGELGLFEIRLRPTGSGEDGFDQLLVERVSGHGYLQVPGLWRGRRSTDASGVGFVRDADRAIDAPR